MRTLKIFGKEVVFDLRCDADESVFEEVFVDLDYRKVDEIVKGAGSLIVDIGAHIGCFSVYCSLINPTVDILAFEPEAENFSMLKAHLKNNRARNVKPKNLAVTGKEGVATLYISQDSHNHSLVGDGDGVKVNVTTLDKVLAFKDRCDLVKMDCEGAEVDIFKNVSVDTLKKVGAFYIEYHDKDSVAFIEGVLRGTGFKVNSVGSRYDSNMGFIFAC